ncbi:TonB-dependent receptor plug domain-containing protein [Sporomusa aerivorans]|uniref:TonB-dependent receptor plug domain-containing protein n=1 Tax=Sporomusa aerivorans TaxID=204936 RepID=UPI00352B5C09
MRQSSRHRKISRRAAAWALLITLTGTGVMASAETAVDKAEADFSLDTVIVTAQRMETRELDTPATVTVLDEKALKSSGARTVFDALAFTQGITNFAYGPGGQDYGAMDSRVVIRGFDRGALVLINGAPINLLNKNSLDSIPLETVERIEIVKGASSTLYGAEAFGGVINIITKTGGPEQASVGVAVGNVGYRKYLANYVGQDFSLFYSKQDFGAEDRTSPDRRTIDSTIRNYYQNRGKGDKENWGVNVNLNEKWNFNYLRSEGNSRYGTTPYWDPATDPSNKSTTSNNKSYHYKDIKDNATLTYDDKDNSFKSLFFYGARDLYGETTNNYTKKTTVNTSNYKAYNLGLDTQKSWKLREGKDNLLAGLLVSHEQYENAITSAFAADRDNYALYAQYSHQLTPRFTAIVGARAQQVDDPVQDQSVFIPQLQTVYKINDKTSWYTNIGKAFQMPPLNQYFEKNELASGRDLKPQEGWNYETGYKIINGDSSWKFAVYKMDFKNKFAYIQDDAGQYVLSNKGKFRNTGFEAEYTKVLNDHWKVNTGFNYGNPETEADNGGWEQAYPKMQLSAGVQYEMDKWLTSLTCNYLTKRQTNKYGETIPSAITLNAVFNYRMSTADAVTLNLNNILDKKNVITHGGYDYWDLPFNWTLSWTHSL